MTETCNMSPDVRLTPAPNVCFADVGDQCCLLDPAAGAYFMLNPVGAAVWRCIQAGKSLSEAHQVLLAQFSVSADTLWADMQVFLEALRSRGLVRVETVAG